MNEWFVILVAAPLVVYLLIILFSVKDIEPTEADLVKLAYFEQQAAEKIRAAEIEQANAAGASAPEDELTTPAAVLAPQPFEPFNAPRDTTPALTSETTTDTPSSAISEQHLLAAEPSATQPADITNENELAGEASAALETLPPPSPSDTAQDNIIPASAPTGQPQNPEEPEEEPVEPTGPLQLPAKGSPKFAFDYRGRLWIEKKQKGFFRQLRRPQLPPEEPK